MRSLRGKCETKKKIKKANEKSAQKLWPTNNGVSSPQVKPSSNSSRNPRKSLPSSSLHLR